jgi:RHS repeat-associated protein
MKQALVPMLKVGIAAVIAASATVCAPAAVAAQISLQHVAPPKMFGYAAGPAQRNGTAAGKAHYVPASTTTTRLPAGKGRRAPVPDLALPPMAARTQVHVGVTRMARGHAVAHHGQSPTPSPATTTARVLAAILGGGTDNASYSVAAAYDTAPMADQSGQVVVTLTNTGTSTWSEGYGLGAQVFSSSDTTGTGTPLNQGPDVQFDTTVAPGQSVTVESVTPAENPGTYTICWDMVNASGVYFSAEGGNTYCAPYTVQQYSPTINEQEPLPGTDVDTQTPELSASATVPGGFPANPEFWYAFEIVTPSTNPLLGTATWTVAQSSGWVTDNGNSWTPPTALTWGDTYYWQVTVANGSSPPSLSGTGITWTTPISFVVGNAQPAVSGRLGDVYQSDDGDPVMTSDLGDSSYGGSGKTVDPKTANVSQQVTDASVATAGPALAIVRTYNSLDPRTSQAFGAGWSSLLDMALVPDPDGSGALILTLSDGQQVRFAKNAEGGYAPPQDFYAIVGTVAGGGLSVTDQTGTTYSFGQASGSSWLISEITDDEGMSQTFSYSSGALTTITNMVSGRALHLTWSTPSGATYPHVATVSTDPVTAGQPATALTWTYGYTGDLLTSVCPPGTTTACTTYKYITNGSHAPTAVLNSDPTSYYRLDDPSGATAAANEVPVDDLTTMNPPATEMNTTPGVAGPIPGVTATSFNGTSSFIPLDGAWCTTAGQPSSCISVGGSDRIVTSASTSIGLSVWFKTSAANGILIGLASIIPGDCTTLCSDSIATPLLWIGSNGHLDGYGSLTSSAAVDNGAWHQAVLIPGQALYLDGQKVATGTTSFSAPAGADALLGTGLVSTNVFGASWEYFKGSMADLSVYQDQLPSVGTVAAQYAAETQPAAELTTIISPGGRTEMSATYDTVNDRVESLTDAHGGQWTYSGPVTGSSSAGYDDAVLGSSPEDFWPLSDASGPTAGDLVGGAATAAVPRPPATYANVTLGVAGPTSFPDGTAASFSGSGSQISIPGGYFSGGGGAGESVEFWFKTTSPNATLLSATAGSGGSPPLIWLDDGCLSASIAGQDVTSSFLATCETGIDSVDNGTWHQVVLTLSSVESGASSTTSQTATLYLDGAQVTSEALSPATVSSTGYTAYIGDGPDGDFTGSIADVSFYTRGLATAEVTAHYDALANQISVEESSTTLFGVPTYLATPTLNTQTITVTSPLGKNAEYVYASGNLIKTANVLGGVTWYGYDASDRASTITDPDGYTTYTTHDAYNNVTSTTTCAAINDCQTSYTSYYEDLANPLDPRNNKPTDARDARSSSPYDPTYDTVTSYTASAQIASRTTPPTPACPSGCETTYAYTTGSQAAIGGGTAPPGLVASITSPNDGVTSYGYDSAGDVAQVTDPLGMVTDYTYDNLGRELSQTQVSTTYPAGLTTTYTYDDQDRLLTQTDPPVTDRVTGAVHTEVTSYTYDADDDVLTTTISDATGGDPSRTTIDTYDAYGNLASTTDPAGNKTTYTYDALGDQTSETNPAGMTTLYAYDAAGDLLTTTVEGYTGNPSDPIPAENLIEESRAYDPAGRLASVTNVKGTTTDYTYYGNGQLASSYVAGPSGPQDLDTYSYDAAGNALSETGPDGLVINAAYNAAGQTVSQTTDPTGVDRTVSVSYDPDGNVVSESLAGGGVTQTETMTYDALDELLSQTVDNTSGNLTTTYGRDQRGLVISQTDPEHNTTTIENDEAGRPVVTIAPAVAAVSGNGAAPVTANPVTMTGYDTFGDETESDDADGNVTTYAYDQDGRETSETDPSYTPPGSSTPVNGTTTMTYNDLGEETKENDPLGNATTYGYDQLGDETSETDPSGVTTFTYDPAGEQTSVTDPTGAQTQATYDNLGRMITTTDLVRQNASAAYTTTYGYDNAGNLTSQMSPTGVTVSATYNAVGEETSSTDGAGNTTSYAYDLDGHLVKETLPDGTATTATYDPAGRPVSQSDLSASGAVLRTESASYDPDGQLTSATDFRGDTETSDYDATGMLTSQTQPVSATQSITVGYGYDLDGNRTALTDGNGNTTYTTYNSLGLPETTTEPSTAQWSGAADSQTTDIYDGNGDLVTEDLPGGVQVDDSYNAMGDLTSQSGSGASAATATRTFSYDASGRLLAAATSAAGTQGAPGYQPATSESFAYDDRGLLLSASGSAGTSTFTYNGSGQPTSVTDAAGTSTYTYNNAGLLATDTDAASATTGTYSYNSLDQVTQISYGAGNDTQAFGYDDLHRLTSDTADTASGAQVAAIDYGYDADNDVTSMTTSGLATTGGGSGTVTNTYGYDESDRLTSWTATPAGGTATTQAYGYDNDGNLTSDNGVTYSYDARDELVSDSNGNTYNYSPDGDLASQNGSAGFASDAYGQQVTDGSSAYVWDALDRVISASGVTDPGYSDTLTYDGETNEVASDSSDTYSRDPAGAIVGVDSSSAGQTLALNDEHDDLVGVLTAAGTSLTGSTTYDPWGQVLATSGPSIQVGYQGQWTDPLTQQVSMGSRFYRPGTGGFVDRDTYAGAEGGAAVSDDLYAYADDNPMSATDPTGHSPSGGSGHGSITEGQVRAAWARADALQRKAATAGSAAASAAVAAGAAKAAAFAATATATLLNGAAKVAEDAANKAAQFAAAAFRKAQDMLHQAEEWQDRADAAWASARQHLDASHGANPVSDWANEYDAGKETVIALYDEGQAGLRMTAYYTLEGAADAAQFAANHLRDLAQLAKQKAQGAARFAKEEAHDASESWQRAQELATVARGEEAAAFAAYGYATSLAQQYASQQARKALKASGRLLRKVAKTVAKTVAKAVVRGTVAVAKAAYKYSGVQDVVSCATNPTLASCAGTRATQGGGAGATRVFWSGGNAAQTAATKYAVENGGETLGMTPAGQAVEAATKGMPWEQAEPLWNAASKKFAEGASGVVHVFIDADSSDPDGIWARTELPALVANPNVTDIDFHVVSG